ncbi:hypothetical protein ACSBLW_15880 [Thioclava sp. FR2]|uniref:hypothetical protein n=1 Tax=Thioclava sp. FR2 TaxID=3445780 RepID=UPI003EBF68F8
MTTIMESDMLGILAESLFTATRITPAAGSRELRQQMRDRERKFRAERLAQGQDPYDL